MTFKIKARNDNSGKYGVTPFDDESGESLSDLYGTRIFDTFELAWSYAYTEYTKIVALGDDAAVEVIN